MDIQPLAIDLRQVEAILHQELTVFRELAPQSASRHKRLGYSGSFVGWAALFLPEAFSGRLVSEIETLLNDVRELKDFSYVIWDLVAPLDVALFSLSGNPLRLEMILSNLAHEKSFRRQNIQEALALAAMLVPWDVPNLVDSIFFNTTKGHGCAKCAAIVAAARGPRDAKLAALAEVAKSLGSDCEETHRRLAEGEAVDNPFFEHMRKVMFMALHRFAILPTVTLHDESERGLFWWSPFNERAGLDASAMLWKRLVGHPMLLPTLTATNNLAPWPSGTDVLE